MRKEAPPLTGSAPQYGPDHFPEASWCNGTSLAVADVVEQLDDLVCFGALYGRPELLAFDV